METYQFDLRDVFRDGVSPGWVLNLILQLPVGSRFYAEKRGGQTFRGWDETRYALAAIVNAIRALQYTYISANSKSKPAHPQPFPVPDRPVAAGVKPGSFSAIAAAHLNRPKEED